MRFERTSAPSLGDRDDVLGPEPGLAVVPDHGLEHEHVAGREHDRRVEVVAEIGADERRLRAVGAGAVREIEVGEPRRPPSGFHLLGDASEVAGGDARLHRVDHRVDHGAVARALRLLHGVDLAADDPRVAVVGLVALVVDPVVDEDDVAARERRGGRDQGEHDVAGER